MFPLRDENPTEIVPFFTIALIAANVAMWFFLQGAGFPEALESSVCTYGAIPAELTGELAPATPGPCPLGGRTWITLLSSMFLHGGWLHLLGNMWFLWIFGNNVEDSMGHVRFVSFYVLTGLAAEAAHIAAAPGSPVPMVGASGAISGVMGAYLVLYPRVRVHTLFFFFVFIRVIPIPAWFVLLEWFAIQLLSGLGAPAGNAGVAFWAHVGGFVAGAALIKLFARRDLVEAKKQHVKLGREQIPRGGW